MNRFRVLPLAALGFGLFACRSVATKGPDSSTATASMTSLPPFRPFPIYTDENPRNTHYVASGYMGDNDLTLSGAYIQSQRGEGPCLRVNYKATGPGGWAGLFFQDPANNWGTVPGRAGYDLRGAIKLSFWARGDKGGERISQFRVGGLTGGSYPDSDVSTLGPVTLSTAWKKYEIDLRRKDLRHIIGGFGFSVSKADNPSGATFYLNDIYYEGPQGIQVSTRTASSSPQTEGSPLTTPPLTAPAVPSPTPPAPLSTKDMTVHSTDSGLKVSFSSQLLFPPGRANLSPGSSKVLDQLVGLLSAYPTNRVLIEGHTDSTGNRQYNLELSKLRATAVRDYLIKNGGHQASRFDVIGYGDTRPIADNTTNPGRTQNRRVEVTILKNSDK